MIRQVRPHNRWPSGDRIHLASVKMSPEVISTEFHLLFERDLDDLGEFCVAAVELSDGEQVWFERHEGDPTNETLILMDSGGDPDATLQQVANSLSTDRSQFSWLSPLLQSGEDDNSRHASG